MAIPSVTLSALTLQTPALIGQTLSVESGVIPVVILADSHTRFIDVTLEGTTLTLDNPTNLGGNNQFTGTLQLNTMGETVQVTIVGRSFDPSNASDPNNQNPLLTPTLGFNILFSNVDPNTVRVSPPSGVNIHKMFGKCRVEWEIPSDAGLLGVRVLWSTDPSGVKVPYQQFGNLVGSRITRTDTSATPITSQIQLSSDGERRITTLTEAIEQVNYSSVIFSTSDVGDAETFYVLLSTVVQDSGSNHVFESVFNGPFLCGFVDLRKASPTDFPYLQNREDIAGRMISEILSVYPDLDLTPRSELRDLFIDPVSIEIAEMSTREWFSRCASSISALAVLDDSDGDGVSDPSDTSPFKQQLARAWHLSAGEVQTLIDKQFDLQGEAAGLTRGGSTPSVGNLTVYTYNKPTKRVPISDVVVATVPDQQTPSIQFSSTGSAVMDSTNVDSFYDSSRGWWSVDLPLQCNVNGSIGNVGAETIRQGITGIPQGFSVINLEATDFGRDREQNSAFAERIADRLVTGVDPGSRNGYLTKVRSVPGVTSARVVASGDLEMLRDWDPIRKKHAFGTVDIYVRGADRSQNTEEKPFIYANSATPSEYDSYLNLSILDRTSCSLRVDSTLSLPVAQILEISVSRGSSRMFFGVDNSHVDYVNGVVYLDPNEKAYILSGDVLSVSRQPLQIGSFTAATNTQLISYLSGPSGSGYEIGGNFRSISPLHFIPSLQPVLTVENLNGEDGLSGVLDKTAVRLIKTQDPLIDGGSNRSSDEVRYDTVATSRVTVPLTFGAVNVPVTNPITLSLGKGVRVSVDATGNIQGSIVVRSTDSTTMYIYGVDYTLKKTGPYGEISITRPLKSSIPVGVPVQVSMDRYKVIERLIPVQESVTLKGATPTPLSNAGFVHNVWLPESYGDTTLSQDADLISSAVPWSNRYIKVTFNNGVSTVVYKENVDFTLSVDSLTGQAYISRLVTGHIPEGAVSVSYFRTEMFTLTSIYPGFVQAVGSVIDSSRHAAADVSIKAMIENPVDISMTVELDPNASPDTVDPKIRTVCSLVLDQCKDKLTQSEIIRQVKSISGVTNIQVPLTKFAKSDGAYDIGQIIPTGTPWIPFGQDSLSSKLTFPLGTYISSNPLLTNMTIPSGGLEDAYVGLLYEGQMFTRLRKFSDLATASAYSFYIIGLNDQLDTNTPVGSSYYGKIILCVPQGTGDTTKDMVNPSAYSFRVTYQVWNEGGYKDIVLSSSEYLKPGKVIINYILKKKTSILS